jgi:hypothetical protein
VSVVFEKWKWLKDANLIVKVIEDEEDGAEGLTFTDPFMEAMEKHFPSAQAAIEGNIYPAIVAVAPQVILLSSTQREEVEGALKQMLMEYYSFMKANEAVERKERPGVF